MTKVIIAATELELSLLTHTLPCDPEKPIMGCPAFHAVPNSRDVFIVQSGPGIANAAAATAVTIERYNPIHIFNVGVCGVYSNDISLLSRVVVGVSAVFADAGLETDDKYLPLEAIDLPLGILDAGFKVFNIIKLYPGAVAPEVTQAQFLTVSAASGGLQRADTLKHRFKILQKELVCEDMESAAVGLISLKASIPCTILRGISNLCGERNHKRWRLSEAAKAAQKELLNCL